MPPDALIFLYPVGVDVLVELRADKAVAYPQKDFYAEGK